MIRWPGAGLTRWLLPERECLTHAGSRAHGKETALPPRAFRAGGTVFPEDLYPWLARRFLPGSASGSGSSSASA